MTSARKTSIASCACWETTANYHELERVVRTVEASEGAGDTSEGAGEASDGAGEASEGSVVASEDGVEGQE